MTIVHNNYAVAWRKSKDGASVQKLRSKTSVGGFYNNNLYYLEFSVS